MYDEVDFVPHGSVNGSCTWTPDFLEATQPYLGIASEYFRTGSPKFELSTPNDTSIASKASIAENFRSGDVTDQRLERWSLPTRFGKEYGSQIEESSIEVLSGYCATTISQTNDKAEIESIEVAPIDGKNRTSVRAKTFVISAGGQETTRLLLKSPQVFDELDEPPAALGKYYQGHVSGKLAFVKFHGNPKKTDHEFIVDSDGVYCRRRFQFTKDALVKNKLLNVAFWLDNPPVYDPSHGNGVLSFIYMMMITPVLRKRLLPPAIARSLTSGKKFGLGRHLLNILKGMPGSMLTPAKIFVKRYLPRRKLPGVCLRSQSNRYALHFHSEQEPHAENRMALSDDGEKLVIDYRYTDQDVDSVIRAHQLLDSTLQSQGCGELEYLFGEGDFADAIREMSMDGLHQVGTTRIADNPRDGVVDNDLRVWGTQNLYLCSSSVFPTSSQANPTFFLGVCAARLANHLTQ